MNKDQTEAMDKFNKKLKIGAAKFSVPSLKNDIKDSSTMQGSIF